MTVRKYTDGTGITQRNRVEFSGDLSDADWLEWKRCNVGEIDYITEIETRANTIIDEREAAEVESVQSPEWYAKQALMHIGWMRADAKRGNINSALNRAIRVGLIWKEAEMKFLWEDDVLVRHSQRVERRKNANKGGAVRKRDVEHTRWRNEDARLQKTRTQNARAIPQSKADRARAVKKNLELGETIDAISRRLD